MGFLVAVLLGALGLLGYAVMIWVVERLWRLP